MKDTFLTQIMIDRYKRTLIDLIQRRYRLLYGKYRLNPFDQKELDEIESGIWNVNNLIDQLEMVNEMKYENN